MMIMYLELSIAIHVITGRHSNTMEVRTGNEVVARWRC